MEINQKIITTEIQNLLHDLELKPLEGEMKLGVHVGIEILPDRIYQGDKCDVELTIFSIGPTDYQTQENKKHWKERLHELGQTAGPDLKPVVKKSLEKLNLPPVQSEWFSNLTFTLHQARSSINDDYPKKATTDQSGKTVFNGLNKWGSYQLGIISSNDPLEKIEDILLLYDSSIDKDHQYLDLVGVAFPDDVPPDDLMPYFYWPGEDITAELAIDKNQMHWIKVTTKNHEKTLVTVEFGEREPLKEVYLKYDDILESYIYVECLGKKRSGVFSLRNLFSI